MAQTGANAGNANEPTETIYIRTIPNIEFVRVLSVDGDKPAGELYGTVKLMDAWDEHTMYGRSSVDPEKKGPRDYLTLIGPIDEMSGYDLFVISVNLCVNDKEISRGDIFGEPRTEDQTFENYDKCLEKVIEGEHGSVVVGYSNITYALRETIKIQLPKGDGEKLAEVYGTINALQVIRGSSASLTLFDKSSDERVVVGANNQIPLSRPIVVVPLKCGITVDMDLWDNNGEIVKGSMSFESVVGTQSKSINVAHG